MISNLKATFVGCGLNYHQSAKLILTTNIHWFYFATLIRPLYLTDPVLLDNFDQLL